MMRPLLIMGSGEGGMSGWSGWRGRSPSEKERSSQAGPASSLPYQRSSPTALLALPCPLPHCPGIQGCLGPIGAAPEQRKYPSFRPSAYRCSCRLGRPSSSMTSASLSSCRTDVWVYGRRTPMRRHVVQQPVSYTHTRTSTRTRSYTRVCCGAAHLELRDAPLRLRQAPLRGALRIRRRHPGTRTRARTHADCACARACVCADLTRHALPPPHLLRSSSRPLSAHRRSSSSTRA
jgi:hypothetical protein